MDEMIRANDVYFKYEEESANVLNGVSLDIKKGELVAILGANGCGKSTIAKHFNGILLPSKGNVVVEFMDTADEEHIYDIRQKVGMFFQNPDNQIVATIVEEDVAFALENLGVEPKEIRTRIDEAMQMSGIYKYKNKSPHNLSGGQKQRVAIAGVIAMRPDCLVMDESTAMLDPRGRERVMNTVRKLNKEFGITVVMITHYMEEAAVADRVIVMGDGEIKLVGTPKEVFSHAKELKELKLDVPQACELCLALRDEGYDLPIDAITTDECANALYDFLMK